MQQQIRDAVFFQRLSTALRQHSVAVPSLLIDFERLRENCKQLKQHLNPHVQPRLVLKSLPCLSLLRYVSEQLNSQRFMVFHQPFLTALLDMFPQADILLGKPMPAQALDNFYSTAAKRGTWHNANIQWLVDTPQRVAAYAAIAKSYGQVLKLSVEIDIGLHRGGAQTAGELKVILDMMRAQQPHLRLAGLMGYDAHVTQLPRLFGKPQQLFAKSQIRYQQYVDILQGAYTDLIDGNLCLNGAGSLSFMLHKERSVCNDIAIGSILLKPSDFDQPLLENFRPAVFIAAPVLKVLARTRLPGLGCFNALLPASGKQTFFIYGGKWMAGFCWPPQLTNNRLYGLSSNQSMVNAPSSCQLQVDDFMFLRPTQSEAVLTHFQEILVCEGSGNEIQRWPTLRY